MSKIVVGVLRGGPSSEYEVSLKTGSSILKNLPEKYRGQDIFISKDGIWHIDGVEHTPEKALKKVDVIVNGLHGEYGEDGKVQNILDMFGKPYTGSMALASALGMNKAMAKDVFKKYGIKTPLHKVIDKKKIKNLDKFVLDLFRSFPMPAVVKPVSAGSSVGVSIARSMDELIKAIDLAGQVSPKILIEEFIPGREATCGVIDDFRGQKIYSLLPVEIIKPDDRDFFDFHAKYSGKSQEICPGNFSKKEKEAVQELAVKVHKALGLRHYSRTDFIINPKRGVYVLETNTLPGLTEESLLPKSLKAVGASLSDFIDHIITLALKK